MKFDEAIKLLQEGKKIRQEYYAEGVYLYLGEDGYICWSDGEKYRGMGGINLTDEWEVCGEIEVDDRKSINSDTLKKLYKVFKEFVMEDWNEDKEFLDFYYDIVGDNVSNFWYFLGVMNRYYKLDE